MKFRAKTLGGALLAGSAAVMIASGPAAAGTDIYVNTTDPYNSAAAGFKAYGEVFTVCDNRSDGKRASAHIGWVGSSASYWIKLEDTNGAGNSCARKDLSIAEGETVTVKICIKDGANGAEQYCATKRGTA